MFKPNCLNTDLTAKTSIIGPVSDKIQKNYANNNDATEGDYTVIIR